MIFKGTFEGTKWSLKATSKDTLAFRRDYRHKINLYATRGISRDYDLYDDFESRVMAKVSLRSRDTTIISEATK